MPSTATVLVYGQIRVFVGGYCPSATACGSHFVLTDPSNAAVPLLDIQPPLPTRHVDPFPALLRRIPVIDLLLPATTASDWTKPAVYRVRLSINRQGTRLSVEAHLLDVVG